MKFISYTDSKQGYPNDAVLVSLSIKELERLVGYNESRAIIQYQPDDLGREIDLEPYFLGVDQDRNRAAALCDFMKTFDKTRITAETGR